MTGGLLGCHVLEGADDIAGARQRQLVGEARDAEVGQLRRHITVGGTLEDDHVLGLDVAVHDAAFVGVIEGVGEHRADREQAAVAEPARAVVRRERAPLDQLGDEVVRAVLLAGVEQRHDRRVLEPGGGASLPLHPRARERVLAAERHALDGDAPRPPAVLGDPDRPVPAGSDLLEQPVAAEHEVRLRVGEAVAPGRGPRARKRRHRRAFDGSGRAPARAFAMM